jgi:hypothetical protein
MDRLPMARDRAAIYKDVIEIQSSPFSPLTGQHS